MPDDSSKLMRWLKCWLVTMATETKNIISQFIYYKGQLLKPQDGQNMSDFIIYINIFGEFDNFKDWDAAQEKEKRLSRFGRSVTTPADGLVGAAVTCKKKKTSRF